MRGVYAGDDNNNSNNKKSMTNRRKHNCGNMSAHTEKMPTMN